MVRPWKAPSAATRWVRPVRRVSLSAASLASAPELVKKTLPAPAPSSVEQPLGQLDLGPVAKKFETWPSVCSWVGDRLDQGRVARGRAR